jgi:hypothetical protein
MRLALVAAVLTMLTAFYPTTARAVVVFSNTPEDTGHALAVLGTDLGYNGWATSFTTAATYTLSEIDVAVAASAGTPSIFIQLWSDAAGLPGSLIDSQTVALPGSYSGLIGASFTDTIGPGSYWVAVLPGAADTDAIWYQNSSLSVTQGATGDGTNWGGATDFFPGVAQVLATPEPASLLLVGGGLLALSLGRKFLRRY